MSFTTDGPNAQQIAYWSEVSGPRWVAQHAALDAQIGPLGLAAMDRAEIARGARVLDVGCGCGDTLLQLADRVGDAGSVLGVDISAVMLERATHRVREAKLAQVETRRADAQTHAFAEGAFDHVFSRFGVMFFADPTAAFANLRRALASGGCVTFLCWQPLAVNPWMQIPMQTAARHVTPPPPPAPGAPGPYSFAAADHVRGVLEAAGLRDVRHTPLEADLVLGADVSAATELCLRMGPAAAATRLAEERGEVVDYAALRADLATTLEPFLTQTGVRMPSASWIVQARRD